MKRAEAVRDALLSRGIDASRISVRSYGEENPMASNDTGLGRWENRSAQAIVGGTGAGTGAVGSSQGSGAATSSGQGEQGGQRGENGQ
jgi:hypothetical protein